MTSPQWHSPTGAQRTALSRIVACRLRTMHYAAHNYYEWRWVFIVCAIVHNLYLAVLNSPARHIHECLNSLLRWCNLSICAPSRKRPTTKATVNQLILFVIQTSVSETIGTNFMCCKVCNFWRHVPWRDVTWRDVTWRDVMWRDVTWPDMIWQDMTWHDMTWHDTSGSKA